MEITVRIGDELFTAAPKDNKGASALVAELHNLFWRSGEAGEAALLDHLRSRSWLRRDVTPRAVPGVPAPADLARFAEHPYEKAIRQIKEEDDERRRKAEEDLSRACVDWGRQAPGLTARRLGSLEWDAQVLVVSPADRPGNPPPANAAPGQAPPVAEPLPFRVGQTVRWYDEACPPVFYRGRVVCPGPEVTVVASGCLNTFPAVGGVEPRERAIAFVRNDLLRPEGESDGSTRGPA